jgi:hypothetical protein
LLRYSCSYGFHQLLLPLVPIASTVEIQLRELLFSVGAIGPQQWRVFVSLLVPTTYNIECQKEP